MVMIEGNYTKVSQVSGIEYALDFSRDNLYGFQRGVFRENIEDIRQKIHKGLIPPSVKVIRQNNNFYMAYLIEDETGKPDGGHHRAYAHYLEGKFLPVSIIDPKYIAFNSRINIKEIIMK